MIEYDEHTLKQLEKGMIKGNEAGEELRNQLIKTTPISNPDYEFDKLLDSMLFVFWGEQTKAHEMMIEILDENDISFAWVEDPKSSPPIKNPEYSDKDLIVFLGLNEKEYPTDFVQPKTGRSLKWLKTTMFDEQNPEAFIEHTELGEFCKLINLEPDLELLYLAASEYYPGYAYGGVFENIDVSMFKDMRLNMLSQKHEFKPKEIEYLCNQIQSELNGVKYDSFRQTKDVRIIQSEFHQNPLKYDCLIEVALMNTWGIIINDDDSGILTCNLKGIVDPDILQYFQIWASRQGYKKIEVDKITRNGRAYIC